MRFLLDADMPYRILRLVRSLGHDATHVRDIGMGQYGDPEIAALAFENRLCLVTGDFGFADIRKYPPDQYCGLVVLEISKRAPATVIAEQFRLVLETPHLLNAIPGRLVIVGKNRIRFRPPLAVATDAADSP